MGDQSSVDRPRNPAAQRSTPRRSLESRTAIADHCPVRIVLAAANRTIESSDYFGIMPNNEWNLPSRAPRRRRYTLVLCSFRRQRLRIIIRT
jgi:hypothetical protein